MNQLMVLQRWWSIRPQLAPQPPSGPGALLSMDCKNISKGGVVMAMKAECMSDHEFPWFLPQDVLKIKDPFARNLAQRIERLPVHVQLEKDRREECIWSSCIRPSIQSQSSPVVLLHCFDSSCLEWRCTYPLLEKIGLETWAVDVLGWGFSDLETRPPCDVASKRNHLYQFWKSYIRRPMVLVGPSLGGAVAIDFTIHYPEAVEKLVLINACVYSKGTERLAELPKFIAYAGVSLLKSFPLRLYANTLAFSGLSFTTLLDWTNVGRLHCLLPWWKDATINFMISGGYDVGDHIKLVKQGTLIIYGEDDNIIHRKLAVKLHSELQNRTMRWVRDCGHLPHVEKPKAIANLIADFSRSDW